MVPLAPTAVKRSVEVDAVDVYTVDLRQDADCVAALLGILDEDEQAHAARFATDALQRKYIVSHGCTRLILSRYLSGSPEGIRFVHNQHGKPSLLSEYASQIQFNLSHSGEKCLVGVTSARSVGVDIERIRPLQDWQEIAQRFFSRREAERLNQLPEPLGRAGFFATWSRKEAYIKALGVGLALDLGAFEVEVDPREQARLLWAQDPGQGPETWCMQDIAVEAEYRAAVVVYGQRCLVQYADHPALSARY